MSEPGVAFASSAPFERDESLSVLEQIRDDLIRAGILYHRAYGHFDDEIFAALARTVASRASRAVLCAEMLFELELRKVVEIFVGEEYDVAAVAAVPAVGSAVRDVLFAMERDGSVAAVARLYEYLDVIQKHSFTTSLIQRRQRIFPAFFSSSIIACALRLPAPIASITVAAPVMASPPVYSLA